MSFSFNAYSNVGRFGIRFPSSAALTGGGSRAAIKSNQCVSHPVYEYPKSIPGPSDE